MVELEIVLAVLLQPRHGHAHELQRDHVGPAAGLVVAANKAEEGQLAPDRVDIRQRLLADVRGEAPDLARAEIAFRTDDVIGQRAVGAPGVGVGARAHQPYFLGAEEHHADGAPRMLGQISDELGRRGDDAHARPVVEGAGGGVPAVQVSADDDDLLRRLGARNFGDHIAARHLAAPTGVGAKPHADRLPAFMDALDLIGVRRGDGERGDVRAPIVGKAHHAGMREPVRAGAHRADQHAGGAAVLGHVPGVAALAVGPAIALAGARGDHAVVDEDQLAVQRVGRRVGGQEIVKALEEDDLGLEPAFRRRRRAAQRNGVDLLGIGRGDRHLFIDRAAAGPQIERKLFDPHVFKPQLGHHRHRPVAGARLVRRAGEPRADFSGQAFGDLIGEIAVERGLGERTRRRRLGLVDLQNLLREGRRGRKAQRQRRSGEESGGVQHGGLPFGLAPAN